jgi:hypothetical protein
VFAALALSSWSATASEFSVGWIDVKFAEAGWKSVPLSDKKQAYSGDMPGALQLKSKVFLREATATGGQVVVVVRATSSGLHDGSMVYEASCKPDNVNYLEGNVGFSRTFSQCLVVTPAYESEGLLKDLDPELIALRDAGTVAFGKGLFLIWSRHAVSTGSIIDVRVYLTTPLTADISKVTEAIPNRVFPTNVAWGRQLKDAVKSTSYSISGRLAFPPIP